MSDEQIGAAVRRFLDDETLWGELDEPLADDQPLLDSGMVDSLELAALVADLEARFQVDMAAAGLSRADFESVDTICALVRRCLGDSR